MDGSSDPGRINLDAGWLFAGADRGFLRETLLHELFHGAGFGEAHSTDGPATPKDELNSCARYATGNSSSSGRNEYLECQACGGFGLDLTEDDPCRRG